MSADSAAPPRGYVTVRALHGVAVVHETEANSVTSILERSTLYTWAASVAEATRYQGRIPAYGVSLPLRGTRVVVRHATHGGLLAPLTRDRFIASGRAPHELRIARALRDKGVPTPEVIGYALYRAGPLLSRSDVLTSEVECASDLAATLAAAPGEPRASLEATARLFVSLANAGAHHADLNLKNVLIARQSGTMVAWVLDVDRVRLGVDPREAMSRNLARFERSARKWRTKRALAVSEVDLRWLAGRARELAA